MTFRLVSVFFLSLLFICEGVKADILNAQLDQKETTQIDHEKIKHIVICGGIGSRLWPLSRQEFPKQFLKLFPPYSLFQKTIINTLPISSGLIISCHHDHFHLALRELKELNVVPESFLLESIPCNTGPAIALVLQLINPDEVVLITPADHWIEPQEEYLETVKRAKKLADQGSLVVFGIHPTFPATGYGYIESEGDNALRFHEKPSKELAENYLKKGGFDWNSGMLCGKAKTILEALKNYSPDISSKADLSFNHSRQEFFAGNTRVVTIPKSEMKKFSEESFDIAVLERIPNLKVVKAKFTWSDIGSFDALFLSQAGQDDTKKIFSVNAHRNHVIAENKIVGIVGLDDIGIIDTKDALLVYKQGNSELVKDVVKQLKTSGLADQCSQCDENYPWGVASTVADGKNYKVRLIKIYPKARLPEQYSSNGKHLVVVEGSPAILIGGVAKALKPNEEISIPKETVHCIENLGDIDLVLVETQVAE